MKATRTLWIVGLILILALLVLAGPAAITGAAQGTTTPASEPESCVTCHPEAGAKHQASYDEQYQDKVIQVTELKYSFAAPDQSTVSFKMTKNGLPFDAKSADSLAIYFVPFSKGKFQFDPPAARLSLKGALKTDGSGGVTTTMTKTADYSKVDGLVVVYGYDEKTGSLPARVTLNKYPFAALLKTGAGVTYASAANNAGCEKCHSIPYLKHGYIYGQVGGDKSTDFYTCKACHLDNGEGGHFEWQLLVSDPAKAVEVLADATKITKEITTTYAYETSLMNDVHMSHAMEFPYPQSMANCVTCHEGKLDKALADTNFTVKVCKSCHAITSTVKDLSPKAPALKTVLPKVHDSMDLAKTDCTTCHGTGKSAPAFKAIHTGYDKLIYTDTGVRYSSAISVTITSAAFADNKLNVKFSAGESPDIKGVDVSMITPTVLIGLYGWDTKDFIIGPHERLVDDNKDGVLDSKDSRNLEAVIGAKDARITTVSAAGGKWEINADLSAWADLIKAGTVKRVEIGVMPTLKVVSDTLALDAPSRTFNLTTNKFDDKFYSPIVKVAGCENCHDALGTTFHTADRGGSVVVCRLCHITKSGGSHLEMASRSIDSYAHAIHSGQEFDIATINFKDPVAAEEYTAHVEFPFPTHGITNCEACHVAGTYNVPSQSKSLPGLLSASATVTTTTRHVGAVPAVVTGPASRACGGCHRASLINEDNWSELVSFNVHTKHGGYTVEAGKDAVAQLATLMTVINQMMAIFK